MLDGIKNLKDIYGIEYIEINFLPYIFGIVIVVVVLSMSLIFFINLGKKLDRKQKAKKELKSLDFDTLDDKSLAYKFSIYGFITLEKHYEDEFYNILSQLERYKYKKSIPKLDEDLKDQMKDYIRVRV